MLPLVYFILIVSLKVINYSQIFFLFFFLQQTPDTFRSCLIKKPSTKLFFSLFLLKASYQTCLCTDSISLMRRMKREQPKRSCVCRTRINWTQKVSPKANCQVRGSTLVTPTLVFRSLCFHVVQGSE